MSPKGLRRFVDIIDEFPLTFSYAAAAEAMDGRDAHRRRTQGGCGATGLLTVYVIHYLGYWLSCHDTIYGAGST